MPALRDVQDHAVRVSERTDSFRQLPNNMLTANATQVTQRQNEEITRLTEATYQQSDQAKQISPCSSPSSVTAFWSQTALIGPRITAV